MWIGLVFVGFAIGATTKNARRANSIPQVLSIALGFLPPVYYPLSFLPAIAQPLAMLIPTTHAAQLAKYYFGLIQISTSEIVIGWTYLLGFAALMGFLASRRAHWVDP
jgi:ABC-2 type transport system permease protein